MNFNRRTGKERGKAATEQFNGFHASLACTHYKEAVAQIEAG